MLQPITHRNLAAQSIRSALLIGDRAPGTPLVIAGENAATAIGSVVRI